jgi:hypothetical protein
VGESWNCFEFIIPYTESRIENFRISAYSNTISNFSFNGKTESTITGTIMQANEKEPSISTPKAVANLAGGRAKKLIDNMAESLGLNQKIKDAIIKVSGGDYSSAIKNGLNYLSGSILGWKTDSITQYVNLKSYGTITLSGTSSTSLVGQIAPLTLLGNRSLNDSYGGNLGLWDLQRLPKVSYERYTTFQDENGNPLKNFPTTVSNGSVLLPLIEYESSIPIVLNPAISQYVTSMRVSPQLFFYNEINGVYYYNDKINQCTKDSDIEKIIWDQNNKLFKRKYNPPMQRVGAGGQMGKGWNWYDWGTPQMINLNCGISVTVELEFNYHGKRHSIISTRNYKADVVEMEDNKDIPNYPNNYIVRNAILIYP